LLAVKRLTEAMDNYSAALRVREPLAAADPNNAELQRDLSISHEKIGSVLAQLGKSADALAQNEQSLRIDTKLLARDPADSQERLDCAEDHENIAMLLARAGDLSTALANEDQARQLREWVALKDDKNVDVRRDLALNYKQLGADSALLAKRSREQRYLHAACEWYERALAVLRDLQSRGALDEDGSAEMKRISDEISKCETAMKATHAAG